MSVRYSTFAAIVAVLFIMVVCAKPPVETSELKTFPLDNLDGIIDQSGIQMDMHTSSDGNGAAKITVRDSTTVRLFEVEDLDIDNARLIYQAKVRCQDVEGLAFLEMLCHFPGKGDFFSRNLQNPLRGSTGWATEETFFMLKKGEKPDIVKLNLVITGKGTVWVDDISLSKASLQ